jgi:pimeloyl-ACP methyl ester carboxylesterase
MEPQDKYAKVTDGVNIAWYATGGGPPFVWSASPLGSVADHWRITELRDLMEFIARRSLLVSFDPRGFGLSDRGPMDYSCEAMVSDLGGGAGGQPGAFHAAGLWVCNDAGDRLYSPASEPGYGVDFNQRDHAR